MSNLGQAVLTIGGTIVGAYFGYPQLGYLLGSLAGQEFFPTQLPTARGPRLGDATVQSSALGAPIPWVWGTYILAGEMIWRSPFVERKVKEKAGGKGGPEQTSIHYEYRANFAIGLCKGPIVGVRRIWADTKLIYDATRASHDTVDPADLSSQASWLAEVIRRAISSFVVNFDLYLGDETQNPDPTIETWEGVGEVPAYRGLAYLVFRDFELADYGNRIPNFRVEVMTAGTVGDADLNLYSNDVLYPWMFAINSGVSDPRNPVNGHTYRDDFNTSLPPTLDFTTALTDMSSGAPDSPFIIGEIPQKDDSLYIHGWSTGATANDIRPCDDLSYGDPVVVYMKINRLRVSPDYCVSEVGGFQCPAYWAFLGAKYTPKHISDGPLSGYRVATAHGEDPAPWFAGMSYTTGDVILTSNNCDVGPFNIDIWHMYSQDMAVQRTLTPPDPCLGNYPIPGAPDYCSTIDGQVLPSITWTSTPGTWHALRKYAQTGIFGVVTSYPLNPIRPSTHPQYNDQAFWEAAYEEAVANGDIEAGLTYGVDYPQSQTYGWVGTIGGTVADPDPIPLAEIVADICDGCGLTSYDVADLEGVDVHGYALTVPTTGKQGIDPLRPFGYFDAVESELVYKFVRRGHDSALTLNTDDLSARLSSEDRPPAMTVVRTQDQELPRLVRTHFIDLERDGDPGQAEQQRQIVDSVNTNDLSVPVVMSQARGQAIADAVLFESWIGRNTYQCSLPFKYITLEPTDCIDVDVDGTTERLRITRQTVRSLAVTDLTAVRDDASIYSGTDIVGTNEGGTTIPEGGVPSPTDLILLELPSLRTQDTDCGYYAAARGLLSGWPGAIIYRATSASGTFRQVAWTSIAATMGIVAERVDTVTDSGDTITGTSVITGGVDHSTVLRVQLYSGTFESVSEDDLLAGENLIAVGQEGDWELLRFQIATQGTDGIWELSGLLREQENTTRREIDADDKVVLMTGPGIMRIDESDSAEGVSRVIRAVTSGTSLEDADDHEITTTCLSRSATATSSTVSSVISRSLDIAPLAPSCDDAYIVAATPASDDAWYGYVDSIARYDCTTLSWVFTDPVVGKLIYVQEEGLYVYWDGAAFIVLATGGGGGSLTDGDYGDIIVSGGGTILTIDPSLGLTIDTDGTLSANSDSRVPSQKAVKTFVNARAFPRQLGHSGI